MRLYAGRSTDFIDEAVHNRIADKLKDAFFDYYPFRPSPSEVDAWRISLRAMSDVFEAAGLDDHAVVLEYQLPLTSCRLGRDGVERDKGVIVELKQWEGCKFSDGERLVRTFLGGVERDILHPSAAQVGQYQLYPQDVYTAFHEGDAPVGLESCAYLHNYRFRDDDPILADKYSNLLEQFPLFGRDHHDAICGFLAERLDGGDGLEVLRRVDEGFTSRYGDENRWNGLHPNPEPLGHPFS